jgi:hypothetical protein
LSWQRPGDCPLAGPHAALRRLRPASATGNGRKREARLFRPFDRGAVGD